MSKRKHSRHVGLFFLDKLLGKFSTSIEKEDDQEFRSILDGYKSPLSLMDAEKRQYVGAAAFDHDNGDEGKEETTGNKADLRNKWTTTTRTIIDR